MFSIADLIPRSVIQALGPSPTDEFWYQPAANPVSSAGVRITPERAMTISTVFRCVAAISGDVAAMPLKIYERQTDGGKREARNHPLYDVLHDQPNSWQTSFEWREMMQSHALMRGNGYSLIEAGARGFADALTPLDPSAMTVEQLENGRLRYTYREGGRARIYEPERIFHLRGMGSDGIMGYSVITLARDSLGLTAATEEHGARQFGQGVRIGGVIESTENVGDDARKRFAEEWRQQYSGLGGAHRTPFLPRGMTFRGVTLSNEDAQFLETRTFQREQIAMEWFGVPIHRVGTSGTASFAAGIEQLNLGYIAFTLLGWIRRWESAIRRDLILAQDKFFAEFTMDHLLRGDAAARANYHRTAIVTGWETRNEVRALENLNPLPGLDEPLVPQNMSTLDEDGNVKPMSTGIDQPQVPARPGVPSAQSDPRGRVLAETIAGRLIRKEIAAIGKASNRLGEDREGFKAWATEFYRGHAQEVARDLSIDNGQARAYCGEQLTDLMVGGSLAPATWEVERTPRLARLALGDGG